MAEPLETNEHLETRANWTLDVGLFILRILVAGFMLTAHGWGKLSGYADMKDSFGDPIGLGSTMSLTLAVGAEFFCSLLVIFGLFTRLACIPLIITMLVAAFVVHADDPWQKKEFALLYAIPFFSLVFTGPGKISLDAVIWPRIWKKRS